MLEEKVKRSERETKVNERQLEYGTVGKGSLGDNAEWRLLINAESLETE